MPYVRFYLFLLCFLWAGTNIAQTSDDQFRKPLAQVLAEVQQRFGISIRYADDLVKDKWVTYADWRYKPDAEKTLAAILASQDLAFAKEGEKKYKLQAFQYHLKTVEEGKAQLAYLSSLYSDVASWEKRKAELKQCILSSLKLTNLPVKLSSQPILSPIRKFNGYTVQNIAIETLPGLYVSGSLYRPAKSKGKLPVVLNPDGHFAKGRYREDCQYRCAALAQMGAMAFSYDLFGWDGESLLQIENKDHRRSLVQSVQALHAMWILDYLLSLKEADTTRVAITGASGGGSQSMLMAAIDDRIKLSVPVAMLSSYHSGGCPCESGMGVHLCGGGTNNAEIAAMVAPKPMLVVSDGKDWTQNVPQAELPFIQNIYGFYGKTDAVENVHLVNEGHDYGRSKRAAMYEFVVKHFGLNLSAIKNKAGELDESKITIEAEAALKVFGERGESLPANAVKGYENVVKLFENAVAANSPVNAAQTNQRYKVAVVDLMILKRQKLGAFQLTKEIGADGVEVDMGGLGNRPTFDNKLLIDSVREQFLAKAKELDLSIPSLAMTGYYAQSFCQRQEYVQSIEDCIKTAKLMNVKVAFLPLGVQCDLAKNPELRDSVVARMKVAGRLAEKAGVVIGIETALDAKEEVALLKEIGSPAIKSYFNFSNALKNGRDVNSELKILGKNNIVQIHCTDDDGVWLQNNTRLDMKKVKQTLDEMGWSGWLVIERSRDAKEPTNVKKNFSANTAYVKSIFQQ
ncbi:MAG TPA: TIM barrel protein [Flavisolibacter sp.]|nr:TIM barrel protein [Flavisolibacter sp.]